MHTVTSSQARARFYALLRDVQRGEQFLITRRGRPIAWLVPAGSLDPASAHRLDMVGVPSAHRGTVRGKADSTVEVTTARARTDALAAVRAMQGRSVRRGISSMPLSRINDIINRVRRERRPDRQGLRQA